MKLPFVRMTKRAQNAACAVLHNSLRDAMVDGVDAHTINGIFAFDDDMQPTSDLASARWLVGVVDGKASLARVDNSGVMHAVVPD